MITPARGKEALKLLSHALEEYMQDGAVLTVYCDVCGSLINVERIANETYFADCKCGKFRGALRGISADHHHPRTGQQPAPCIGCEPSNSVAAIPEEHDQLVGLGVVGGLGRGLGVGWFFFGRRGFTLRVNVLLGSGAVPAGPSGIRYLVGQGPRSQFRPRRPPQGRRRPRAFPARGQRLLRCGCPRISPHSRVCHLLQPPPCLRARSHQRLRGEFQVYR